MISVQQSLPVTVSSSLSPESVHSQTPERQFKCTLCESQFCRSEHLQRHMLSNHSVGKVFECKTCFKTFNRNDVLQRHSLVHQSTDVEQNQHNQPVRRRVQRACTYCASARTKCSGGTPCSRCQLRGMDCEYPIRSRTGRLRSNQHRDCSPSENETSANPDSVNIVNSMEMQTEQPFSDHGLNMDNVPLFNLDYLLPLNWLGFETIDDPPYITKDGVFGSAPVPMALPTLGSEDLLMQNDMEIVNISNSPGASSQNVSDMSRASMELCTPKHVPVRTGSRYVDSEDGARASWVGSKRRKVCQLSSPSLRSDTTSGFPKTTSIKLDKVTNHLSQTVYTNIVDLIDQSSSLRPDGTLSAANAPRSEILDHFIDLYLESFQSIFPLLHEPTIDFNDPALVLAVATIGSHYVDNNVLKACERPLQEALAMCLVLMDIRSQNVSLQTKILQHVIMMFSGDNTLSQSALVKHGNLVEICRQQILGNLQSNSQHFNDWQEWIQVESQRRTFYCLWLLDAMLPYHFGRNAYFTLNAAQLALPCHERIWEATTAIEWEQLSTAVEYYNPPTLEAAIQILYTRKELDLRISEFGRILIIHGIYQETASIKNYFSRPLAKWVPTHSPPNSEINVANDRDEWLPADPVFSKYRNAACDCLDVLHWAANSQIAAATSFEHPTVLHLHTARLVLLTPFVEIKSLLVNGTVDAWREVWRWRNRDQHKARLALIHAGVVFWHVRRYSTNSFHEPNSIFLAALALWAYGSLSEHPKDHESPASNRDDFENVVRLDRPCDDEFVQKFVRDGENCIGYMTGIGDICSKGAPLKVLRESAKVLRGLSAWGCAESYATILEEYAEVERQ